MQILSITKSLCPECLKILKAELLEENNKIYIKKICPEHGEFKEIYWSDAEMYKKAKTFAKDGKTQETPNTHRPEINCPKKCGLCEEHKSHTALANLVVTNRCDLNCWYCFFYAQKAGYVYEPSLEQIKQMIKNLRAEKPIKCNVLQLTGGNPELREDLIDILKIIKNMGIKYVQVNINGTHKLYKDSEFAKCIKEAGTNIIYLSFDGTNPKTNPKNHYEIPRILENCRKANLGLVLVPTIINTINDHDIGNIVKFGLKNMDIVRGVNFQPVSFVGKISKEKREKYRITIPDVIKRIEEQTNAQITKDDFFSVPYSMCISKFVEAFTGKPNYELSAHFACGMATYIFKYEKKLIPITRFVDINGLFEYLYEKSEEIKNSTGKTIIGLKTLANLGRFIDKSKQPEKLDLAKILFDTIITHKDNRLIELHNKSFFLGMMHFQDLYNYDIERVKRCCIHYIIPDKTRPIIPFCVYNVIPEWHREPIQKKFGTPIQEYESKHGKLSSLLYKRDTQSLTSDPLYKKTYAGFI